MRAMRPVLLTGFEPFDGDDVNPSWEAARRLDGTLCRGRRVAARLLPCAFDAVGPELERLVAELRPEIAVAAGLAGGRAEISLERVAINVRDARIPDNAGAQPVDAPCAVGGPAAYLSTLPIKATLQRLRVAGLPAVVSNSAGTFVCNHTFYLLRHLARGRRGLPRRAGFVHLPWLPEQAARRPGQPSLALDAAIEALRISIETALDLEGDIAIEAGAVA